MIEIMLIAYHARCFRISYNLIKLLKFLFSCFWFGIFIFFFKCLCFCIKFPIVFYFYFFGWMYISNSLVKCICSLVLKSCYECSCFLSILLQKYLMALFLVCSAGLEEQVLGGTVMITGLISNNVILQWV